jgi:antirestriction protein ArdC
MPARECFVDEAHYYSTALHELAHWTGAKGRLDRTSEKGAFGTPEYAKEEIRADMASLFLSAELGIPYDRWIRLATFRIGYKCLRMTKTRCSRQRPTPRRYATSSSAKAEP